MAEQFVALGLQGVPYAVDNYHKAWHPVKQGAKKIPKPFKRGRRRSNPYGDDRNGPNGQGGAYGQDQYGQDGDHAAGGYEQDDPGYDSYEPPRRRTSERPRDRARSRPRAVPGYYSEESPPPRRRRNPSRAAAAYYSAESSPSPRRDRYRGPRTEKIKDGELYIDEDRYRTDDGRKVQTRELVIRRKADGPLEPLASPIEEIKRDFPPPSGKPRLARRTTSLDREDSYYGAGRGRVNGRRSYRASYHSSDDESESSVPPRRRKGRARSTVGTESRRSKSTAGSDTKSYRSSRTSGRRDKSEDKKKYPSSDSEISSSEDERRVKHMKTKELLAAGFATVATVHASNKIYKSLEARDKRHQQVMAGEMSPEEAKKKKNQARVQDLAAVGLAALGIKGAMGEWKKLQDHRDKYREQKEARERHHSKRQQKRSKSYGGGGRDRSSNRSGRDPSRNRRRDQS